MGQTTDEMKALRAERGAAAPTLASEIGLRSIQDLKARGVGSDALAAGNSAPDFALPDQNGRQVRMTDLLAKGPVVLNFYRGAWCPFCNIELRGLQRSYPRLQELGASLVAISPQLPDASLTLAERHGLGFPVLSDVGNAVARRYGLVFRLSDELLGVFKDRGTDLAEVNGDDGSFELPVPATFVLDRRGIVRKAWVHVDHTHRTDPDDVVAILESAEFAG